MASAEPAENTPNPEETMEHIPEVDVGADGTAEQNIRNSGDGGSSGPTHLDKGNESSDQHTDKEKIIKALGELMNNIRMVEDIPECLHGEPLTCLKEETKQTMMYFLDPESDVMTGEGKCKDYRGVAEWANLDTAFCKYITDIGLKNKINDVLSMWIKGSDERRIPDPTIGNLRKCLIEIDRPDALSTLAPKIAMDAIAWQKTRLEAHTNESQKQDTSWQLTRHDVLYGKMTYYTACLMFADEDYRMAQIILNLYKKVKQDSLFFVPQFDLKFGKYEKDTTARIICERCDHKVIFLLSQYFLASKLCEFTTNYAAQNGTNNGNIIPFHLTRDVDHVPNVLRGIVGIRWFRQITRSHSWEMLTEGLFNTANADEISRSRLEDLKREVKKVVDDKRDYFLSDPPYDLDTPAAGEPIQFDEPEGVSGDASMLSDSLMACASEKKTKAKFKMLQTVRKIIVEKVLRLNVKEPKKMSSSTLNDKHTSSSTSNFSTPSGRKPSDQPASSASKSQCDKTTNGTTKTEQSRFNMASILNNKASETSNCLEMTQLVAIGSECKANGEEHVETDRLLAPDERDEGLLSNDKKATVCEQQENSESMSTIFHSAKSKLDAGVLEGNAYTDVDDTVDKMGNDAGNMSCTTETDNKVKGKQTAQHSYVV
ncbi:uncharacterized protein LOC127859487 [Dreissena polymorpha]|uniref:uncharacterized protein LOC127859487 n=1 Tax=Dreissena polymorpha TaxID=45954 RepID=UPI0022646B0D|nr:uncharacterized protein LOC127859487 [Dreissena polymorpha]XP_052252921.1 uncharacterized protein LOC127859487 [Dreissena polymorpha]